MVWTIFFPIPRQSWTHYKISNILSDRLRNPGKGTLEAELKSKKFSRGGCPWTPPPPLEAWGPCLGNRSLSQIYICLKIISEVILARSLYHKLRYFFIVIILLSLLLLLLLLFFFFATSFFFHSLWILIFSTALQSFWLFKVWEWQTIRSWKISLNWSKKEWKYDR